MSKPPDRVAVVSSRFQDDLRSWFETDGKTGLRVLDLMRAILADRFGGIGKPEPLRYALAGCWSRRITQEHRIVYRVTAERIEFLQARYRYAWCASAIRSGGDHGLLRP
jgi:toxin YoeB